MSRMKHTAIAMAVVVLLIVSPTSKAHSTGIPVIDTANLVQSIVQALAWIQQFQQMQQQILQADQQIHAIMGSRNMGSLMNNLTLAGVVPSDVNAVYHAIRSGGRSAAVLGSAVYSRMKKYLFKFLRRNDGARA